ncbi:MAG: serine hydrolase [Psychrosphaera sp.]|nr:serine hydrolase [Psychrosphaera sp.]
MAKFSNLIIAILCLFLFSCGGGGNNQTTTPVTGPEEPQDLSYLAPPTADLRKWLTHEELHSVNLSKNSAYHNSYFMPVGNVEPAAHTINDTLTISGGPISGFPTRFDDNLQANRFPNLSFHVFSHNGNLIPSNRDIIIPQGIEKQWRVILSPGKSWMEPTDGGMSRASFPFVLVDRSWNNALNGVATFLFDDTTISNIRLQIVQHTSSGFIHEGGATLTLSRANNNPVDLTQLKQQFDNEMANLLPTKPWQALIDSHPTVDFDVFDDNLNANDISASAIWYDNTLYMQNCNTRYGQFPYCQFMRHGIYSATKSATGAVALSFLAQRYGIEVLDYKVSDYLQIVAPHNGWDDVTFIDLLNMAAGIGNHDQNPNSSNYHADENQAPMGNWSRATSALEKFTIATTQYANFPWGPGEVFRYNTTHTFMLSAAMDGLVRQRENSGLWPLLLTEVYQPIGITHLPMMQTTESDDTPSLAVMGIGLYPTVDEAIKIANLLHNLGMHQSQQILHPQVTQSMLYRTVDTGFNAVHENNQHGEAKYHRSFWGTPFKQGDCFAHIPFMNGYGGNLIGILPNGIVTLRFADAQNYRTLPMVTVASQLAPLCQK